MRPHVNPDSYRVHIPPAPPPQLVASASYQHYLTAGRPYPSDHYLITATINI